MITGFMLFVVIIAIITGLCLIGGAISWVLMNVSGSLIATWTAFILLVCLAYIYYHV